MSYNYADHQEWLASDEGIKAVGEVLRNVRTRLVPAGAAMMHKLWPSNAGNTDRMMAAVDHVVTLGVIVEVTDSRVWGQHRVFRES